MTGRSAQLAGATVLVLGMIASPVAADEVMGEAAGAMRGYFAGERRGGMWLIGMGVAGMGTGAYLHSRDGELSTGMSYPLVGVGVVHAAAGVYVILASRGRVRTFERQIRDDTGGFVAAEYDRVGGVQTQFTVLKIVEGALIAGGVGLAIYGEREDRSKLTGVGVGLAVEAASTLVFDIVAARRASRYRRALGGLRVTVTPDATGGSAVGMAFSTAF